MRRPPTAIVLACALLCVCPPAACSRPAPTDTPAQAVEKQAALAKLEALKSQAELLKIKTDAQAQRARAAEELETMKATTALTARRDFQETVQNATGWILAALAIFSVVLVVAAVVPFVHAFIPVGLQGAGLSLGAIAIVAMLRYGLLRFGVLAATVGFWVSIAAVAVSAALCLAPLAVAYVRRSHLRAAQVLADKGDARASVAVMAAAMGVTGESSREKVVRKGWLEKAAKAGASDGNR